MGGEGRPRRPDKDGAVRGQHEREGLGWILLGARPLLLAAGRQRLAQLGSPLEQWRCR